MVRHRYELVNETTQRKNKLTAICDELFPEFTQICKDPNLASAVAIRRRFPTRNALVAASVEDLCATRVGTRPSDKRLADLRLLAAMSICVRSENRVQCLVFEQDQLLDELALLTQHLERLESEMTLVVGQCREGQILTSIPGIGAVSHCGDYREHRQHRELCALEPVEVVLRPGSDPVAIGAKRGRRASPATRLPPHEANNVLGRVERDPGRGQRVEAPL